MKNYAGFSAKELLDDDYFIQSHKERTPESDIFWNEWLRSGKLARTEYEQACFVLSAFRMKKECITLSGKEELWKRITDANRRVKRTRRLRVSVFISAAASLLIVLLLYVTDMYDRVTIDKSLQLLSQREVTTQGDEIHLILPKKSVAIKGQNSKIQYDSKGNVTVNSEKLQETDTDEEHSFNQLIVPNGKRSTLVLEDGTKMWVNAGSRVIYPNKFKKNRREIFVDGEVYMEVARDEKRPFVVATNMLDVQVLGTSFNVTAYKDDAQSSVVLASGSVRVSTKGEQIKLVPNEMLAYSEQRGSQVKEVVVADYISWKDGIYIYHSEPLSSILNRISRYYGKEISYDPDVAMFRCSGKLNLLEDLDSLLEGLTHTVPVDYTQSDEKYTFKKRN